MGKAKQLGRIALSFLPKVGVIPPPQAHRPDGISAMMTVKDEEDWIEKSIRSIEGVVDEVVVVDNGSTDGTPQILAELGKEMGGKLRTFSYEEEDFCAAVNYTLARTRYHWVFRWSGDFVARTTGPLAITGLTGRSRALDPKRYYCLWLGPVSLDGDLFHQIPQVQVELEPLLFVYSPGLMYRQVGRFEELQVPWYYKRLEWRELYFFHMRYVKPSSRILYRFFWTEWMSLHDKRQFPTLDSFVRHRIRAVYGTSDIREAMRKRIQDLGRELVPYDKARFGEYPALLGGDLLNPKYLLIYDGGLVVSRNDIDPSP